MSWIDLLLIAIGVSMDAFSVSLCKGLSVSELKARHAWIVGAYFGGFQSLMPAIGYFFGRYFQSHIERWDHWVVFFLLAVIGANMLWEALKKEECPVGDFSPRSMLPLAVATSVDALAIGITFAVLSVNVWLSVLLIGVCTFTISAAGVVLGHRVGQRYQQPAQIAGGVILILIGVKIVLEHLHILTF
ncbi:MAG: manganese efflux pump MntP family protein [Ndongobacter sp.]|nr:manganese efflux pump MntP family protein [Ndongobacter sp.]